MFNRAGLVGLLVATAASAGCGRDEIQRYRLSGDVQFEGKPVPAGTISFEPEQTGVGGGFAPIRDGRYDTDDSGRGHLGGKHRIMVTGFDGLVDPSNPDSPAKVMFSPYEVERELPQESSEMDFDVPQEQAAEGK